MYDKCDLFVEMQCPYGPDRLCLLWEETAACYFYVVIYCLLVLDNSLLCRKIVNFLLVILTNNWLFSNMTEDLQIGRFSHS